MCALLPLPSRYDNRLTYNDNNDRPTYTRKPSYRRENRAMTVQVSIHIEFHSKSIMERLLTLNTATLSTQTHLAPKPAQNSLNHV